LAAMRIETYIVKIKSHPTGKIRGCQRYNKEANNTEHLLYHCPLARFIGDIVRIMIRTNKSIDVRAALIDCYYLEYDIENKRNRKYCNILMLIAKIIIYNLYYKEDQLIKNNIIYYELNKNIKLILNLGKHVLFS